MDTVERQPPSRPHDARGRRHTVYKQGPDGLIERWISTDGRKTWKLADVLSADERTRRASINWVKPDAEDVRRAEGMARDQSWDE